MPESSGLMPEDYEGGVEDMLKEGMEAPKGYGPLRDLPDRRSTGGVTLKSGGGEVTDAEMVARYHYSKPIADMSGLTKKLFGFLRDAALESHLERTAVKRTNALTDFVFNAPCTNRLERLEDEERLVERWKGEMAAEKTERPEDAPNYDDLLRRWSSAHSFMMHARVVEETKGIDAAVPFYPKFREMEAVRDEVEMEATELPPAEYQLFMCRLRQLGIMRERSYDLAMGHPVHDYKDVKDRIEEGADIHDLEPALPWPWQASYHSVMASMADGEAHRTMLMALIAQELPQRYQQPQYNGPPGYWGPPPGYEGEDGEPNKGKAFLSLFGRNGQEQEEQPERRRSKRGRKAAT